MSLGWTTTQIHTRELPIYIQIYIRAPRDRPKFTRGSYRGRRIWGKANPRRHRRQLPSPPPQPPPPPPPTPPPFPRPPLPPPPIPRFPLPPFAFPVSRLVDCAPADFMSTRPIALRVVIALDSFCRVVGLAWTIPTIACSLGSPSPTRHLSLRLYAGDGQRADVRRLPSSHRARARRARFEQKRSALPSVPSEQGRSLLQ